MKEKIVIRTKKPYRAADCALLRLIHINERGSETWLTTSSPVHLVATARLRQLFENPSTITPSADSLQEVLGIPGQTAWASALAPETRSAALGACLQYDMYAAQGALAVITFPPDFSIVRNLKLALDVIHQQTPSVTARALVIAHDEALSNEVRVELLLTGVGDLPDEWTIKTARTYVSRPWFCR